MADRPPTARPFGHAAEDLEFDLAASDRAALVTALLAACAEPPEVAFWWSRPVGERIAALLAVLRATDGLDAIELTLRCEDCAASFAASLPQADLWARCPASESVVLTQADESQLELRLPTGEDLRAWRRGQPANPEEARRGMLDSLRVAGSPLAGDEWRISEAMSAHDPLVAFSVNCTCPECGHGQEPEIDLEGLALRRLAMRQRALLHEVHALASRYGWTESEILAVAPARRARYLELIEGTA